MLFTDGGEDHGYDLAKGWQWGEEQRMSAQVADYVRAAPAAPAFLYRPGINIPRFCFGQSAYINLPLQAPGPEQCHLH